jgi:hypothetical protein
VSDPRGPAPRHLLSGIALCDPFGRHESRYWDGSRWTEHVASRGRQEVDPPVVAPPGAVTPQTPADWYPDPFGRHESRYWDGSRWTDHVTSHGRQGIDAPVDQPATPTVNRSSKKVERQARRAGAGGGDQDGGGTLFTEQVLVVNQKAKLFGKTLGYAVYERTGQQLGMVREIRRDFSTKVSDSLRGRGGPEPDLPL